MSVRILRLASRFLFTSILAAFALTARADVPQFDEPLEQFQPLHAPTEKEQDRADALAFYGMAREAESRGDRSASLRWFQRALRYDPECLPAARGAMRLAIQLQRPQLGVDAALKIPDCKEEDRLPLRYMALQLTRQGRWEEAIELYERTLGVATREPTSEDDVVMMMEMARLCHLIDDDKRAATYFAQVLKALEAPREHNVSPKVKRDLLGEKGATYQLIGSCFLAAGDIPAAEAAFQKLEEADPNPIRAARNAAAVHFQSGQFDKALGELNGCLENLSEQTEGDVFPLLEQVLDKLGRADEQIAILEPLREKHPDNAALSHWLAQKYFEADRFDQAEPLYASVIEKSPTTAAYQHLLEIYLARASYEKAMEVLAAVVAKTGSLDAVGGVADRIAESEEAVEALISLGKESSDGREDADRSRTLAAALLALDAEEFESAQLLMTSAIDTSPDRAENLLLIWGLDLLSADRYDEAADVFQKGTAREGMTEQQRAVFFYYRAAALELSGRTGEALEAAREAVKLNDDSPPLHVRVAWVLYHAERKPEAAKEYRSLIERFDDEYESDQARQAVRQARIVLSTMCVNERRIDEAVEWLEQVLDEFPEDPGALNDLGYLWADENQHLDRAHQMIERAVAAEPDNAAYRDSLGWVLYRKGQYQQAVTELIKAAGAEPDPVVLDHLGDAYAKTNQMDRAKETWEEAASKFDEAGLDEQAAMVRKKLSN